MAGNTTITAARGLQGPHGVTPMTENEHAAAVAQVVDRMCERGGFDLARTFATKQGWTVAYTEKVFAEAHKALAAIGGAAHIEAARGRMIAMLERELADCEFMTGRGKGAHLVKDRAAIASFSKLLVTLHQLDEVRHTHATLDRPLREKSTSDLLAEAQALDDELNHRAPTVTAEVVGTDRVLTDDERSIPPIDDVSGQVFIDDAMRLGVRLRAKAKHYGA